jgi:hypothetical protein
MCEEMDVMWVASKIGISILGLCIPILVGGFLSIARNSLELQTPVNPIRDSSNVVEEVITPTLPEYIPSHIRGVSKGGESTRILRKLKGLEAEVSQLRKENFCLKKSLSKVKNNIEEIFSIIEKGGSSAIKRSLQVLKNTYRFISNSLL